MAEESEKRGYQPTASGPFSRQRRYQADRQYEKKIKSR